MNTTKKRRLIIGSILIGVGFLPIIGLFAASSFLPSGEALGITMGYWAFGIF